VTGIADLTALIVATLIFLAIPGPGTIKLLASVAEPRGGLRAGVWATLGLLAGDFVWMVLALSGVAALAAAYPRAFDLLRYAGALYLAWIGVSLIRTAGANTVITADAAIAGKRGPVEWLREACLVSLSNPKVIGFYVAFFPLFIDAKTFDGLATYARMIAIVQAIAFSYCMFLITVATLARTVFRRYPALGVWLKRAAGLALIGFSVKFAMQRA
jgi:leucine efflux protein